jgi:HNH endonuclease
MSVPFQYPAAPLVRKHGPRGYSDYESYRPWLRDEFSFRCVYCLKREQWGQVRATFDLDHFQPCWIAPGLKHYYDNLHYVCASCNSAKGGRVLPDPTVELVAQAIRVESDGQLVTFTPESTRLVEMLDLNHQSAVAFRKIWIGIIRLTKLYQPDLWERLMCYPENLPDLDRLRPPDGNSRPEGINQSHYARRARRELTTTY